MINFTYTMENNQVSKMTAMFDGLFVVCTHVEDGLFTYTSKSREDTKFRTAPHAMNLPTCILHAMEFFGMLPPGCVSEDILPDCDWEF